MFLANERLRTEDCEHAEHDAQDHIQHRNDRFSAREQPVRFQGKRGKRGESAAHANLEEEQCPRIERRVLSRRRHNQTKQERAEHVDAKRDEREPALMPQGDEADEIAQDGADKPAEANEYAIQKHGWNLFSRLFFVAGKGTRNLKSIPRSVASGKRNLDAVFFLRFLAKLSRHTNQAFSMYHIW